MTGLGQTFYFKDLRQKETCVDPYLSEESSVEGDREEAVHSPHGDVQVHQQPLLLQGVDCGTDPLENKYSRHKQTNTYTHVSDSV